MAIGIFTILAGLVALAGAYLYFFGLSPETKRKLENQALKTMGENKLSYAAKDQINKIPSSDQEDIKQLKKGISNLAGGAVQNPLGDQAVRAATQVWDAAQDYSRSALERVDWDSVQGYTKSALERVSTMTGTAKGKIVEKTQ
ncbi:uncharacterized protein K460DRAFT_421503 [Cucurbitaria berberidis CBS 394.84]|uniref:Uncharacterized protein n=1 Tax=Cucurbitaria berberidis CBS 394.84 TaxID=1168544 RepID=A0A9P4G8A9_9PLEO|nr:uncharacterized protein K460DRAFT_421503 [Cucurbitaria berberidis CBS 394.84]KAF1840565.1 hypothetical protein K460DRAFT_421503 [Cucurbitaria berberidis CBS 394.84]